MAARVLSGAKPLCNEERPGGHTAGAGKLADALRRLVHPRAASRGMIDISPGCAFGVVVEERLKEMERQLGDVKDRVNGLIYLVVGAVVVEVVLRLMK